MYRGTTPTNIFNVNVDLTQATAIYITYEQRGKKIVEKTLEDITVEATRLTVELTQEETLKFAPADVEIQIRAKTGTSAIASNIIHTTAERVLKEGVI